MTKVLLTLVLLLCLTACTGPLFVALIVVNSADAMISSGTDETYCSDELRATLVWGGEPEEAAATPGESGIATINDGQGDVTIEAWCYRGGTEVGYVQLRRGVNYSPVPDVFVFPPGESGELLDDTFCETPDVSRGVPLCIDSELF